MVTINTTFHVEDKIHYDFVAYLKNIYIPEAAIDSALIKARLCKIHAQEQHEGHSYSVQFTFHTIDALEEWDKIVGRKLNETLVKLFKESVAGFSTLLEEIEI